MLIMAALFSKIVLILCKLLGTYKQLHFPTVSLQDNIEKLCLVYDSFLSEFPLCHEFWRKYADHKMHLCGVDKVVEVFEQAVLSATYSVDVWVDYCQYAISVFEDPDDIRR